MTYNKWPSPHGHAIASDKTDKMPVVDDSGLLPCPFCGGSKASIRLWSHEGGSKEYTLQCDGCCVNVGSVGFTAANGDTRKAAVLLYKSWNTRVQPQAVAVGDDE